MSTAKDMSEKKKRKGRNVTGRGREISKMKEN
jgi:hypothetical protein